MVERNGLVFREVQRFGLWIRLALVLVMFIAVGIEVVALWTTVLKQQASNLVQIILHITVGVGLPIAIAVLFWIVRLETEVRGDGLYVRYIPFHRRHKRYAVEDLSEYYARTYKPLIEYGGWGIRCGLWKSGRAYNVSGNKGLQLVLQNGTKLLIGSQRPDELAAAIKSIMEGT